MQNDEQKYYSDYETFVKSIHIPTESDLLIYKYQVTLRVGYFILWLFFYIFLVCHSPHMFVTGIITFLSLFCSIRIFGFLDESFRSNDKKVRRFLKNNRVHKLTNLKNSNKESYKIFSLQFYPFTLAKKHCLDDVIDKTYVLRCEQFTKSEITQKAFLFNFKNKNVYEYIEGLNPQTLKALDTYSTFMITDNESLFVFITKCDLSIDKLYKTKFITKYIKKD